MVLNYWIQIMYKLDWLNGVNESSNLGGDQEYRAID